MNNISNSLWSAYNTTSNTVVNSASYMANTRAAKATANVGSAMLSTTGSIAYAGAVKVPGLAVGAEHWSGLASASKKYALIQYKGEKKRDFAHIRGQGGFEYLKPIEGPERDLLPKEVTKKKAEYLNKIGSGLKDGIRSVAATAGTGYIAYDKGYLEAGAEMALETAKEMPSNIASLAKSAAPWNSAPKAWEMGSNFVETVSNALPTKEAAMSAANHLPAAGVALMGMAAIGQAGYNLYNHSPVVELLDRQRNFNNVAQTTSSVDGQQNLFTQNNPLEINCTENIIQIPKTSYEFYGEKLQMASQLAMGVALTGAAIATETGSLPKEVLLAPYVGFVAMKSLGVSSREMSTYVVSGGATILSSYALLKVVLMKF